MFAGLASALQARRVKVDASSSVTGVGTGTADFVGGISLFRSKDFGLHAGLLNQGATCYLNSLLQTLYSFSEFRSQIFVSRPCQNGGGDVTLALRMLFSELSLGNRSAYSTSALTQSFGWTGADVFSQHDASEALIVLLEALQREAGTESRSRHADGRVRFPCLSEHISSVHVGMQVHCVKCCECGTAKTRPDPYIALMLPVKGHDDLSSCLRALVAEEVMENDNAYFCEHCGEKRRAVRSLRLQDGCGLPEILIINLNRYEYNITTMGRKKLDNAIDLPLSLNLSPFLVEGAASPSGTTYELTGVLLHVGGAGGGHYFSYLKTPPLPGSLTPQWMSFNDSRVSVLSQEEIAETFGGANSPTCTSTGAIKSPAGSTVVRASTAAYMLVYHKVGSVSWNFLNSPCDTSSNLIPEETRQLVEEGNALNLAARDAWEKKQRALHIRLYFSAAAMHSSGLRDTLHAYFSPFLEQSQADSPPCTFGYRAYVSVEIEDVKEACGGAEVGSEAYWTSLTSALLKASFPKLLGQCLGRGGSNESELGNFSLTRLTPENLTSLLSHFRLKHYNASSGSPTSPLGTTRKPYNHPNAASPGIDGSTTFTTQPLTSGDALFCEFRRDCETPWHGDFDEGGGLSAIIFFHPSTPPSLHHHHHTAPSQEDSSPISGSIMWDAPSERPNFPFPAPIQTNFFSSSTPTTTPQWTLGNLRSRVLELLKQHRPIGWSDLSSNGYLLSLSLIHKVAREDGSVITTLEYSEDTLIDLLTTKSDNFDNRAIDPFTSPSDFSVSHKSSSEFLSSALSISLPQHVALHAQWLFSPPPPPSVTVSHHPPLFFAWETHLNTALVSVRSEFGDFFADYNSPLTAEATAALKTTRIVAVDTRMTLARFRTSVSQELSIPEGDFRVALNTQCVSPIAVGATRTNKRELLSLSSSLAALGVVPNSCIFILPGRPCGASESFYRIFMTVAATAAGCSSSNNSSSPPLAIQLRALGTIPLSNSLTVREAKKEIYSALLKKGELDIPPPSNFRLRECSPNAKKLTRVLADASHLSGEKALSGGAGSFPRAPLPFIGSEPILVMEESPQHDQVEVKEGDIMITIAHLSLPIDLNEGGTLSWVAGGRELLVRSDFSGLDLLLLDPHYASTPPPRPPVLLCKPVSYQLSDPSKLRAGARFHSACLVHTVGGEPLKLAGGETLVWVWEKDFGCISPISFTPPLSSGNGTSPKGFETAFKILSAAEKAERKKALGSF